MAKRGTYTNRLYNINLVVNAIGEFGDETATQISKRVNLSRQAVLEVLKHAESWGYVYSKEYPYRYRKDGTVLVTAKLWYTTSYGLDNAKWYVKAWNEAMKGKRQLPLL